MLLILFSLVPESLGLVFKENLGFCFLYFKRGIKMPTRSNVLSEKYTLNKLCYRKVAFSLARDNCFLSFLEMNDSYQLMSM